MKYHVLWALLCITVGALAFTVGYKVTVSLVERNELDDYHCGALTRVHSIIEAREVISAHQERLR